MSDSLWPHRLWSARLLFPGKNTGMGCHSLFQGIFLTQGSNPCLLHLLNWQADSLLLVPPGKPYISWAKSSNTRLFYNRVIHWILYWKRRSEWLTGNRDRCSCPASGERIRHHSTRDGKDQNSDFEGRFLLNVYHFYIIVKSKKKKNSLMVSWGLSVFCFRHPQAQHIPTGLRLNPSCGPWPWGEADAERSTKAM